MPFRKRPLTAVTQTCGAFDLLPLELIWKLFDKLDLKDVGNLALVCCPSSVMSWIPLSQSVAD